MRSYYRGHLITFIKNEWVYWDNKKSIRFNERSCGYCNKSRTIEGHDGCLGTLPGIRNACCGHGREGDAYVQFQDMYAIYGEKARVIIERLIK